MLENYVLLWPVDDKRSILDLLGKKRELIVQCLDAILGPNDSLVKTCLRKIGLALVLALYPSRWVDFLMRERRSQLPNQIDFYRGTLRSVGNGKTVSVLSHSAGGRIASHLCDEPNVDRVICFGYPFKHPDKQEEPERTESLKRIQKPFLIIQGTQDEYGGTDVTTRYELSPSIEFEFVNTDHDYEDVSAADWSRIINRIESFLALS